MHFNFVSAVESVMSCIWYVFFIKDFQEIVNLWKSHVTELLALSEMEIFKAMNILVLQHFLLV